MSNLRKRFHMEALETRQMMAGDVAAYVQNGNLYINEAYGQYGLDNGVRVYQLANGMVRVEGAEANDGTANKSLVNGAAYQDFMIPGGLFVNLGGGHDRLHLGFDGAGSAPIFGSMSINMAAPDPVIAQRSASLVAGPGTIFNGPDDDQVFGWGFHSRGGVTVKTGRGNDWVFMGPSTIGDGLGVDNLTINTGAGADTVSLKGITLLGSLYATTYSNAAENDGDTIWIDSNWDGKTTYITGNAELRMGGGADNLFFGDPYGDPFFSLGLKMLGTMQIDTGAGDDVLDIRASKFGDENHWSNLHIYTGAGADDVTIDFHQSYIALGDGWPELTGGLFVRTYGDINETDADVVRIPLAQIWNSVHIYMGGGNDTFDLRAGNWGYDVTVDAGAGSDTGYLAGFLYDDAIVRMGEGDDNLDLGHVNANTLNIDGGNGVDRLRKTQYLAVDYLFENGWEYINGRPTWWDDIVWDLQPATLEMARR
jgi:hypothetical protein